MALVVISIDRTRLPPHTDEDFQEWVEAYIGQSGYIRLVNPLAGMRVADEFRDIEIVQDEHGVKPANINPAIDEAVHNGIALDITLMNKAVETIAMLRAQRDAWKSETEHQFALLRSSMDADRSVSTVGALDAYAAGKYPALRDGAI